MIRSSRFCVAGAAVLTVVSAAAAQSPGKDLAMDFRISSVVEGMPDSGIVRGHMVSSGTKFRIDLMTVGGRAPTPLQTDGPVSMIVSDSGKTITYLDAKNSQYMRMRPAEMLAEAQRMGGMKMDFTETEVTVTSLGAGRAILGHPIVRYRVVTAMTMTMTGMGQPQTVKVSSTTEHHFPTDIKSAFNPFGSITGADMIGMFGGSSKELATKLTAAAEKLPKTIPLRSSTSSTMTTSGMTTITKSDTEVTSVQWVNADPKVFDIPAGFTALQMPTMAAPPP